MEENRIDDKNLEQMMDGIFATHRQMLGAAKNRQNILWEGLAHRTLTKDGVRKAAEKVFEVYRSELLSLYPADRDHIAANPISDIELLCILAYPTDGGDRRTVILDFFTSRAVGKHSYAIASTKLDRLLPLMAMVDIIGSSDSKLDKWFNPRPSIVHDKTMAEESRALFASQVAYDAVCEMTGVEAEGSFSLISQHMNAMQYIVLAMSEADRDRTVTELFANSGSTGGGLDAEMLAHLPQGLKPPTSFKGALTWVRNRVAFERRLDA